ncbi:hypothetical protein BO78DRAFT_13155 [Aspergillus sclerotiicarbonarius CBS 121057]|uniref:Uncharacterized protein n=1 Tax=Aspergillus sclerotiicarbonarius (strain CBS 121057 / IBT 28362) TaxID=1448318 RepID=A0A319EQU5_ASPSB|nr:hypothetical protein BO78DRAFT_13155 [Aspergillus sclerotiicarbonarius CBS 121057]
MESSWYCDDFKRPVMACPLTINPDIRLPIPHAASQPTCLIFMINPGTKYSESEPPDHHRRGGVKKTMVNAAWHTSEVSSSHGTGLEDNLSRVSGFLCEAAGMISSVPGSLNWKIVCFDSGMGFGAHGYCVLTLQTRAVIYHSNHSTLGRGRPEEQRGEPSCIEAPNSVLRYNGSEGEQTNQRS